MFTCASARQIQASRAPSFSGSRPILDWPRSVRAAPALAKHAWSLTFYKIFFCCHFLLRVPGSCFREAGSHKMLLESVSTSTLATLINNMGIDSYEYLPLIVGEFELGKQQIYGSIDMKLQCFTVLPWLLAGVGHHDKATAKRVAQEVIRALQALEALGDSFVDMQPQVTKDFMMPSVLRNQLELFASGDTDLQALAELSTAVARLKFVPIVERSLEAKHGLAHVKGVYRKVTPAYVSLHLRMPELERGIKRQPDILAETLADLESVRRVKCLAPHVGLNLHPDVRALSTNKEVQTSRLWRMTAKVIYSEDHQSQFASFGQAKSTNKQRKEYIARARKTAVGVPSNVTWTNIVEKAQIGHLRTVAKAGRVYSLPADLVERDDGQGSPNTLSRAL